jgi:hypothetical protein
MIFRGDKPATWGHVRLIKTDLTGLIAGSNSKPEPVYTYECDCGRTWKQDKKQRQWHCGAVDCEYLPRRARQKLFPRRPGRRPGFKWEDEGELSTKRNRRKLSVTIPYWLRDEFEEICMLLRISFSRAVQEMIERWTLEHKDEAYKKVILKDRNNVAYDKKPKEVIWDGVDV